MNSFTFSVIKRDKNQDNLYNIFSSSVVDNKNSGIKYTEIVGDGEEGRLDLFCIRVYKDSSFVEEIMMINNIINPFSICAGDLLYVMNRNDLRSFHRVDDDAELITTKINIANKSTRTDPTRQTGVPPTIRPVDFEQIIVDKENQTIKLNTKLL